MTQGKMNLADTYVNAFVNVGLKKDGLMIREVQSGDKWIDMLYESAKIAGIASIGVIDLWDIDEGIQNLTPFLDAPGDWIRFGASIGLGINSIGITDENDSVLGILGDKIWYEKSADRLGALIGLGYAYAGKNKEECTESIIPILIDGETPTDASAYSALSLG